MVGRGRNRHPPPPVWRTVRLFVALMLMAVALAGCTDTDAVPDALPSPLSMYRFHYEGSDVFVPGVEHGWLFQVTNDGDTAQLVSLRPSGVASGVIGGIGETGGAAPQTAWLPGRIENGQAGAPVRLEPGESRVFMARIAAYEGEGPDHPVSVRALSRTADQDDAPATGTSMHWNVTSSGPATAVVPGDHVQTITVGVWLDGTAFYSNAAGALQDPEFPHTEGWTTPQDATEPLPIYVYDADADEQPARSQDTCHFTTISGYNGLLKTQAEGSTNVALLRPEAAYTREGAEDHPLYGDSLVFMNTVVAHDGATETADEVPDPTGACFQDRVDALLGSVPPL